MEASHRRAGILCHSPGDVYTFDDAYTTNDALVAVS